MYDILFSVVRTYKICEIYCFCAMFDFFFYFLLIKGFNSKFQCLLVFDLLHVHIWVRSHRLTSRGRNWCFPHSSVLLLEFKCCYLKNLKLFSIGIKELYEHIVLWKKSRCAFAHFKSSFLRNWLVQLGDFMVKPTKLGGW